MEIYKSSDASEIAVLAATWELNPKITLASLADEFKANPTKALKNYASIVKYSVENAIKDRDLILKHVNTSRSNPWDETRGEGLGGLPQGKFHEWFRGKSGVRYFCHIDIGIRKDSAGVALSHRERTGQCVVDFMIRIPVPFGRDISIAGLREWIYAFRDRGFHIELVSYDGYQSEESRQILEEKGFNTEYVSVDKTTDPYDTLIEQLLTPGRLDYYTYPVFTLEMEELKLVNGIKYDHPKKTRFGTPGSKDVADAVAGSVFSAIKYERLNPAEPKAKIRVVTPPRQLTPNFGDRNTY